MKRIAQKPAPRVSPPLGERQRWELACAESFAMAALYRLIAGGFAYPERSQRESIGTMLGEIRQTARVGALPPRLVSSLRAFSRAWRITPKGDLAAEYSRLFLGTGRVPLREGGFGDGLRFAGQPFDIADLNGFYAAFGFALTKAAPSPPDYLGTEAEFLSLLHLKGAVARARKERASALIVDRAMARFLAEHLGRWVDSLGDALREAGAAAPYARLGVLLRDAVAADCARLKVRRRRARCGIAPDPLAKDRLECPFAGHEPGGVGAGIAA
jgi:TorA maturation chaperone TorD